MRSLVRMLLALVGFTLAAATGLWLQFRFHSLAWQVLTVALGLLALGTVGFLLVQRQSSEATRLPAGAIWRLLAFGIGLLALSCAASGTWLAYQRAQGIVHPARTRPWRTPASVGIRNYQEVSFLSADGLRLRGWYIPPRNGAVVIFVHGLGSNRGQLLDDARMLYDHGYGSLLYDSRNSGESEGEVTTLGLQEMNDVDGAVEFVLAQPGGEATRIGLFGHSMGGATVILAGARNGRVGVVIAASAYTAVEDNIGSGLRHLTGLPAFPFAPLVVFFGEREVGMEIAQVRPVDVIGSISPRAVLVVHGAKDEVIPVSNAYELYAAAGEPRDLYILGSGGHADLLQADPEDYERRIIGFLEHHLLGR